MLYMVLGRLFSNDEFEKSESEFEKSLSQEPTCHGSDAEDDRASECQLKQHLHAFFILVKDEPLSEETIKAAHAALMKDLKRDGEEIHAGEYRLIPVHAGDHTFIHHSKVPSSMKILVEKYNEKYQEEHNSFDLASWLLTETLLIHPFDDGNGRISRLLWCYSLIRDGLPFPVTPFPGTTKAYKKYIHCITSNIESSHQNMSSLTLVSVTRIWKNFVANLRLEHKDKHEEIIAWLKAENLTLNDYS